MNDSGPVTDWGMVKPENFADRLIDRIKSCDSCVCIGLDPDLRRFPCALLRGYGLEFPARRGDGGFFERAAQCVHEFNLRVLRAVEPYVSAVKPQSAYFEALGPWGSLSLGRICEYAKEMAIPVILDVKRNDIGSTASQYARAYLGSTDSADEYPGIFADAVTVTPYLGSDGILPFCDYCEKYGKGIFVLVKTSNKSSREFQDAELKEGGTLAQAVAAKVDAWGENTVGECGYSSVGAVVGATQGHVVEPLRAVMPRTIFLMPGFGAQGAKAEDLRRAFDPDGLGVLVPASRSLLYHDSELPLDDYFERVGASARIMRDEINAVRG